VDDVEIVSARQAESKKSYKDHLLGEPSLMHDSKMVEGPAAYEVPKIGVGNIMKKEGGDRYALSPKFRHMKEDEVQEILRTPEERRESVRRDSDEERRLPLEHVSVSRDGARFAACAWNGRCIIYSPSSKVLSDLSIELPKHGTIGGEQDDILVLRGHVGEVAHATWAPDDKFLATASTDHTVRIWNPVNGRQLLIIEGSKHELRTVAWSVVDGYYLASAGDEGLINIWKMRAWMNFASGLGEMPKKLLPKHNPSKGSLYIGDYSRGAVLCLSWSPVRNILAAGYHDGGALVWDAHSGEKLFALKEKEFEQKINGHTIKWRDPSATHIHAISWHPEEKFIVTGGGDDRAINLWHVHKTAQLVYASEPGDHIASVKDSHTAQIWGIDMSMDGKLLVSCGEDYDINIFRSDDLASNFGRNYDVGRKIEHTTTTEERKDNYKQYSAHGGGQNNSKTLSKRRERILEFERQKNQEKGQR
jgi:WD40 repeat protein